VLIGVGCGLPYSAMFSSRGSAISGRTGAAMGLVNMVGILMILAGAPLVGHLADLTGHLQGKLRGPRWFRAAGECDGGPFDPPR